jgi:hypothetical protein
MEITREHAMLDEVPTVADTSRLSCQLIYTPERDGLAVKLDGELARATWVQMNP